MTLAALFGATSALAWTISDHKPWQTLALSSAKNSTKRAATATTSPVSANDSAEFAKISAWHLFGVVTEKPIVEQAIDEVVEDVVDLSEIPETRIPLKLTGIAFAREAHRAFAIVVTPDGAHNEYRAGDDIGTDATVHLVEQHRVVIERDGKYESLSLPEAMNNARRPTTRTVRAPRRQVRRPATPIEQMELEQLEPDDHEAQFIEPDV